MSLIRFGWRQHEENRFDRGGPAVGSNTTAGSSAFTRAHVGSSAIRRRVGCRDGADNSVYVTGTTLSFGAGGRVLRDDPVDKRATDDMTQMREQTAPMAEKSERGDSCRERRAAREPGRILKRTRSGQTRLSELAERVGFVPDVPAPINGLGLIEVARNRQIH